MKLDEIKTLNQLRIALFEAQLNFEERLNYTGPGESIGKPDPQYLLEKLEKIRPELYKEYVEFKKLEDDKILKNKITNSINYLKIMGYKILKPQTEFIEIQANMFFKKFKRSEKSISIGDMNKINSLVRVGYSYQEALELLNHKELKTTDDIQDNNYYKEEQ